MNGDKPFTYDFDDFVGDEDYQKLFVTKLLRTHTGQYRSLPILYKLLAEELNTDAYLALAPNHLYVKHLDENNRWVNIELTNGHFSTDAYMISSMDISAEAIRNKIYLNALTDKESIAMLLTELALAYKNQHGYNQFSVDCCNKSLEYFPQNLSSLFHKFNTLQALGKAYIEKYGNIQSEAQDNCYREYKKTQQDIEELGYREMSPEKYEKWVKTIELEKVKQE